MDVVRLGVIGLGNMGTAHCYNIIEGNVPEIELSAVCDIKPARVEWALEHFPDVPAFADATEMMDSGFVDAVLIAVPHYMHPPLGIMAFERGLHVLCEKPAGVYTLQVKELIDAVNARPELTFGMMFNQRTNCVYRRVKQLIDSGELGEMKRVNWIVTDWYRTQYYYDSGAWRATWAGEGGGVLLNQCPHNLDMLQWLCGMPVCVRAFMHEGKWHDIEVEDDVTAYLEFENGATGVFITSTGDAPGTNRLEISGTLGKVVIEDGGIKFHKNAVDEREFCLSAVDGFARPECEIIELDTDGENPQHAGVMRRFAANILRGEPLVADGREGLNGLTLSNAMHLSHWLGREVQIPFDEQLFLGELNARRAKSRHKVDAGVVMDTRASYGVGGPVDAKN